MIFDLKFYNVKNLLATEEVKKNSTKAFIQVLQMWCIELLMFWKISGVSRKRQSLQLNQLVSPTLKFSFDPKSIDIIGPNHHVSPNIFEMKHLSFNVHLWCHSHCMMFKAYYRMTQKFQTMQYYMISIIFCIPFSSCKFATLIVKHPVYTTGNKIKWKCNLGVRFLKWHWN